MRELRRESLDRVSWFTVILGQLSDVSKDLVQAYDERAEASSLQNPLQFWANIDDRTDGSAKQWTQRRYKTLPNYRRPQPTLNARSNVVKDSTSSRVEAADACNICRQESNFSKDCRFKDNVQKLIAEG